MLLGLALTPCLVPPPGAPALDFQLGSALPPALTVARADATATYIDAAGVIHTAPANTPRFNHDFAVGRTALLREPTRINIAMSSRDLTTAYYYKGDVTIEGGVGIRITATAAGHTVINSVAMAGATKYCVSKIILKGNRSWVQILVDPGDATNYHWANINLETGEIGSTSGGAVVIVRNMGAAGWLCGLVFTTPAVPASPYFGLYAIDAGDATLAPSILGDGEIGYYADEWQCEAGHCPTSRIRTTDSPVTRNVDIIQATGDDFTRFWNPLAGTALVECILPYQPPAGAIPFLLGFHDGTINERYNLYLNETNAGLLLSITDGGVSQANIGRAAVAAYGTTVMKTAGSWIFNNVRMSAQGGLNANLDTIASLPTATIMDLGGQPGGGGVSLDSPIYFQRIAYWPYRTPDAYLQGLTA